MLTALLTTLALGAEPVDVRRAPDVPPWPAGVLAQLEASAGLLPLEVESEVTRRLVMLDTYPARCQVRLDALGRIHSVVLRGALDVAHADERRVRVEEQIEIARRWEPWQVLAVGAAAALFAGSAGVVVGYAVGSVGH